MKNNFQKVMRAVIAICMVAVMICGSTVDAQAATKYAKSFTKNITVKGGQCVVKMKIKKDTTITVTVSTSSKKSNLNIQAITGGANYGRIDDEPYFVNLDSNNKKGSFTVKASKGTEYLYISNFTTDDVKVKIKVSSKSKVLKYSGKEQHDDMG